MLSQFFIQFLAGMLTGGDKIKKQNFTVQKKFRENQLGGSKKFEVREQKQVSLNRK